MERHRDLTNRAWGNHLLFFGKFDGEDNSWTIPQDPEVELQISSNPPKNDHGQLHRHAAFEPKVAHNSNIWNTGLILKHTPVLNFASKKIAWAKREHSAMPRYVLFSEQLLFLTVGPEGASIFKKPHNSWWTWVNMFHSYWGMGALKFYGYPLVTKHGDNSPFTDDFIMIVPLRPLCLQRTISGFPSHRLRSLQTFIKAGVISGMKGCQLSRRIPHHSRFNFSASYTWRAPLVIRCYKLVYNPI